MGLLQGLTEWLPISSSGHIVIAQEYFGIKERTLFDAILHLGTLFSAIIYFRKDLQPLLNLKNPLTHKVIIGSIPILIIGFLFSDMIEAAFSIPAIVAISLIINGFVLMVNPFVKSQKDKITKKTALVIGFYQVFALFPGISRSGVTITEGKVLGIDWLNVAKYSFFISFIPIIGAAGFKISTSWQEFEILYILGFVIAFLVGYASIDIMMRILRLNKFHYFGIYTILIGIVLLVFFGVL
jgi:undecaprenyl-diphosphatase